MSGPSHGGPSHAGYSNHQSFMDQGFDYADFGPTDAPPRSFSPKRRTSEPFAFASSPPRVSSAKVSDSHTPLAIRSGMLIGMISVILLTSFVLAAASMKPSDSASSLYEHVDLVGITLSRVKKISVSLVALLIMFVGSKLFNMVIDSKSQKYYDPSGDCIKIEHRTWSNAVLICAQKTGLFPNDGSLFQFVAGLFTKKFNEANNLFAATGQDPVTAIIDFSRTHGIDISAIQPDGSAGASWLWSKQPRDYISWTKILNVHLGSNRYKLVVLIHLHRIMFFLLKGINDFFMRRYAKYKVGNSTILAPSTSVVEEKYKIKNLIKRDFWK